MCQISYAGDIGRSLLQPGNSYVLYGLASGSSTVTELLRFSTDPARYDVVTDRGSLSTNSMAKVDDFDVVNNPLTINSNNYNLYPLKSYTRGILGVSRIKFNFSVTTFIGGNLTSNPEAGYHLFPNSISDYTAETISGTTVTPSSVMHFYHSKYYVEKANYRQVRELVNGNLIDQYFY